MILSFSILKPMVGQQERQLACEKTAATVPKRFSLGDTSNLNFKKPLKLEIRT